MKPGKDSGGKRLPSMVSAAPHIMPSVFMFGLAASGICGISWLVETQFQVRIALAIGPFEFAGAALGLLLILRTNAGYDRWWEARIVWGGIVNQSRNLVIGAMAYGPKIRNGERSLCGGPRCFRMWHVSVYGVNSLRPKLPTWLVQTMLAEKQLRSTCRTSWP